MQINDKQTKDNINNNTKFKCPGAIPSDPPERLPRRGGGGFAAGIRQGSPVSLLSPSCLPPVSLLSPSYLPPAGRAFDIASSVERISDKVLGRIRP